MPSNRPFGSRVAWVVVAACVQLSVLLWAARAHSSCSSPATTDTALSPDRSYRWNATSRTLVSMPLVFAPGYGDGSEVWARGLDAAGGRP